MVVSLGNRLAGPMAINIANYEVFEVSTERSLVNCHDLHANCRGDDLRATFSENL